MWNHPKRLDPFQKVISSLAGIAALITIMSKPTWMSGGILGLLIIYVVILLIYLSQRWPSWEWTCNDARERELKRNFGFAHKFVLSSMVIIPVSLCIIASAQGYIPAAVDEDFARVLNDLGKENAYTNQLVQTTMITTSSNAISTNALPPKSLLGTALGRNVNLLPTDVVVNYMLELAQARMILFSGGGAFLLMLGIFGLLWVEKITTALNTAKSQAS